MNREFKIIFDQILAISDIKREFVLGLSGGPDSICLLNLIKDYMKFVKINIYPVIIDHQIREKSSLEAQKVKEIAETIGFKSKIKKIHHIVPKSNIQNWARFHRRNLLLDECYLLNADLILGHHKDDQIETIFMRLLKGSGLQGLIGMRLIKNWQHFKIIRPLLIFSKKEILDYNFSNKLEYVKDVSNMDLKYERVFLRSKIDLINQKVNNKFGDLLLKSSDLSFRLLSITQIMIDNWLSKNIKFYKYGAISINFKNYSRIYENSPRFCALLIGKLINRVGGKIFLPKQRKILDKLRFLHQRKIIKFTLGNVILFIKSEKLYLIRESRNIQMNQQVKKHKICYFDNRFVLITKYDGHLINSNNPKFSAIDLSDCSIFSKYSKLINNSLPLLKTLEGRLIKPYLNIVSLNNINKIPKSNRPFMLYFIKNMNFFK